MSSIAAADETELGAGVAGLRGSRHRDSLLPAFGIRHPTLPDAPLHDHGDVQV